MVLPDDVIVNLKNDVGLTVRPENDVSVLPSNNISVKWFLPMAGVACNVVLGPGTVYSAFALSLEGLAETFAQSARLVLHASLHLYVLPNRSRSYRIDTSGRDR